MSTSPPDRTQDPPRTRVLFVCLGNICRSPIAEGVFRHQVREAGLESSFEIDSAGTGDWHVGEPPDARAAAVARNHGVAVTGRARQVTPDDLRAFDHVVAMDRDNLAALRRMASGGDSRATLTLLREDDPDATEALDVPDPYYGGPGGFEEVYAIVERSCRVLLQRLAGT